MTCQRPPAGLYSKGLKNSGLLAHPGIGIQSGLKSRMGTPSLSPQGKKMDEFGSTLIPKPEDGLGYSRAFCEGIGKLETLERGGKVRTWYAGAYPVVRITRRLPGGCYWGSFETLVGNASGTVVSCGSFGGRVND